MCFKLQKVLESCFVNMERWQKLRLSKQNTKVNKPCKRYSLNITDLFPYLKAFFCHHI